MTRAAEGWDQSRSEMLSDYTPVGCVHGRFQPFHIDHLLYVLTSKKLCRHLIIGLTCYDIRNIPDCQSAPHRGLLEANPFTYLERCQMVKGALYDAGVLPAEISFTPFPIENPAAIADFVPKDAVCFTTIREPWNVTKLELLRESGFQVRVLWEDYSKRMTGTDIRRRIYSGDDSWKTLVPPSTVAVVEQAHASWHHLHEIRLVDKVTRPSGDTVL